MGKFSLLSEYINKKVKKNDEIFASVKYQKYMVEVSNNEIEIKIPLRECKIFENELNNMSYLNENDLTKLLRKFRGIKKIG